MLEILAKEKGVVQIEVTLRSHPLEFLKTVFLTMNHSEKHNEHKILSFQQNVLHEFSRNDSQNTTDTQGKHLNKCIHSHLN